MLSGNIPAVAGHRRPEIDHDLGRKITARSIKTDFDLNGAVKTICPQPALFQASRNRQDCILLKSLSSKRNG